MSRSRRVIVAFAVSVLFHLILFTVLALAPEPQLVPVIQDEINKNTPLEVTVLKAPEESATPTPVPALAASPTPEPVRVVTKPEVAVEVLPLVGRGIKTQLDPANLKKTDKAPENPVFIASHNSVATTPKSHPVEGAASKVQANKPQKRPAETDLAAMEQAIVRKAATSLPSPTPAANSIPRPTPIPHASVAPPQFRTALPSPTPVTVARNTARQEDIQKPSPAAKAPPAGNPAGANGDDDEVGIDAIGKWNKAVANAIGSVWNFYRQSKLDLLAIGEVRSKFIIDANGRVSEIRIVSNTANPTNAMYAVRAVREAEIPPIPPERLARVPGGRVEVEYTFTIVPNQ